MDRARIRQLMEELALPIAPSRTTTPPASTAPAHLRTASFDAIQSPACPGAVSLSDAYLTTTALDIGEAARFDTASTLGIKSKDFTASTTLSSLIASSVAMALWSCREPQAV